MLGSLNRFHVVRAVIIGIRRFVAARIGAACNVVVFVVVKAVLLPDQRGIAGQITFAVIRICLREGLMVELDTVNQRFPNTSCDARFDSDLAVVI